MTRIVPQVGNTTGREYMLSVQPTLPLCKRTSGYGTNSRQHAHAHAHAHYSMHTHCTEGLLDLDSFGWSGLER